MVNADAATISIRIARLSDLEQIVEVESSSFERPYPPALILSMLYLHGDMFYVATGDHEVLGYVVGAREGRYGHVLSIAVKPKWRRKGIGVALMKRLLEEFKSSLLEGARLEVAVSNYAAIALYESLGFKKLGVKKRYYPWGEDAYVMFKRL
ncbi:MAG: ribosomal protein S18-alanine N-acetyltransferase [Candidatus Nezhaarchaeota archaeon]|nr:ribosomal protein S18-alanine N-acetyltransferase [Candidatus Nezhaarchaeota archaeon]